MNNEQIKNLDQQLIQASKKIKVLTTLAWPAGSEENFLNGWRNGNPQLPKIELHHPNFKSEVSELESIAKQCDRQHPAGNFLAETATSYANAGRMLQHIGTPEFTRHSINIYGRPDAKYKILGFSVVETAKFFLDITDNLLGHSHIQAPEFDIPAQDFAKWLKDHVDKFFTQDPIDVVLDQNMTAKVLASAQRIRVRSNATFSTLDKSQLLNHEAFVHSATQLNGKKQMNMQSMGLGAPRTTRTQEGIAVLSEIISNSIDINRLRRIALRAIAIKMALDGADFIEIFKFFLESGQSELESVNSTQRIFRGGCTKGGVVFTKDAVYLLGLLEVHTFIRVAIRDNRPDLVKHLFAGRLTIGDSVRLASLFDSGWLLPPTYVPLWISDLGRFAALTAYSIFINNYTIEDLYIERAVEFEEDLKKLAGQLD